MQWSIRDLAGHEFLAAVVIGSSRDQMRENIPDDLLIFNEADDEHDSLALGTEQGINLPGLRRDRLLFSVSNVPNFF
jgi:hypothetical protein